MEKIHVFAPVVQPHEDALPLFGHPELKQEWLQCPSYPGVVEFCQEHFSYGLTTDSIMFFPSPIGHKKYIMRELYYDLLMEHLGQREIYAFSQNVLDRKFPDDEEGDGEFYYKDIVSYQTSLYKSKRKKNQYSLPCFMLDQFEENYYLGSKSIFWRGNDRFDRALPLSVLESTKYEKDFTITKREDAYLDSNKKIFLDGMVNNLFSFCIRGSANFCRRFYETIMMGRIPILFQSDRCFIFEDYGVKLEDMAVVLEYKEKVFKPNKFDKEKLVKEFEDQIDSWIITHNLDHVQRYNRHIWETYCSPLGFLRNFYNTLRT